MRQISSDIHRGDRKPVRVARKALAALTSVCLLAGVAFQTGCEVKSFIDPSEVGRYNNQPLLLPILKKLDTGFDEPDDEWTNAVDPSPTDLVFTAKDYRIGPGDLLNVTISDLAGPGSETQRPIRVSDSGAVNIPLIDEIKAADLTETELQRAIRKAYRDGNLILDAQVTVSVVEARARTFSIRGSAVPRPGEYQILKKDFRLLDAVVIAGDVIPGAEYAYVIRQQTPSAVEVPPTGEAAPAETPIPTAPATPSPGPDILAPRSQANPSIFTPGGAQGAWRIDLLRPRMMQTAADPNTGSATPAAPATPPEGRYITLDGKQVLVGAATQPTDAAATQPQTVEMVPLTPAVPTTSGQPFAFQDLEPVAGERIIRVPLRQLLNGDTRFNVVIRPSDIITIPGPKTGFYYMGGHVARTGAFQLTGSSVTLKQAIVSAGMLDQVAIPQRTDVIRRIGTDREVFARVNLDAIFAGKQSDIFLKPDDTVMVGTNFFAPFIAAIRNGFRFSYGFGFFYDRNFYDDDNNNNNN
ncbi:polysaccharide biosynthesis/export family protein [Cyanobium sp. Cruz-8H5]|uniref:polysaccharide biosynthesis/export family protein n=1 Tax=Cyanobium sp. Cruz-8H5 TaxID=2823712 RepID=UPI0020CBED01|nr:polysaccharide biosynthesis/export family protein [Cyanobium sp. Cruz-8H5]MCP9861380.1 polysaccharide biosynthesis/export family protein [Cyanobium sp. Cruz-8H5]